MQIAIADEQNPEVLDSKFAAVEEEEIPVGTLSVILRQLALMRLPVSLSWGHTRLPISLEGVIEHVACSAGWLRLVQRGQGEVHMALSALETLTMAGFSCHSDIPYLIGHGRHSRGRLRKRKIKHAKPVVAVATA